MSEAPTTETETLLPPRPEPDADSVRYWDALREHRLLHQHCKSCGRRQLYFRAVCRFCWSRDIEDVESSGRGTVYSYSIVYSVGDKALAREVPYALAIVELDEGPRVMTRIDGDPDAVRIGDAVTATYRDLDDETTLLHFERVDAA
jgi:uncharacterized OB-fold protein